MNFPPSGWPLSLRLHRTSCPNSHIYVLYVYSDVFTYLSSLLLIYFFCKEKGELWRVKHCPRPVTAGIYSFQSHLENDYRNDRWWMNEWTFIHWLNRVSLCNMNSLTGGNNFLDCNRSTGQEVKVKSKVFLWFLWMWFKTWLQHLFS